MEFDMSDMQLAQTLERLLTRIDELESKVDALSTSLEAVQTFSSKAGLLADAAGDSAAHFYNEAEARGIDPLARAQAGLALAEKLSSEQNMALVDTLLDKTDHLALAVRALDKIDTDDLEVIATQGAGTVSTLATLMRSDEFGQLIASADPTALGVAGSAGTALVETKAARVAPVGPFGALMKMMDSDVQRAVGFTLAVAKRFGQKLGES
jgi:uncharacterized protein YjgD (DUF1641 family)